MQIRQLLTVPDVLRATQKNLRVPRSDTISPGDEWARKRARELEKAGIAAETRRYRKKEPLTVVYKAT